MVPFETIPVLEVGIDRRTLAIAIKKVKDYI
jgi:hypothetical protein